MSMFNFSTLLTPKAFFYIGIGMVLGLLQVYNALSINELAKKSEKLREQIRLNHSMITTQKLTADELQSIHNIEQEALLLGLEASHEAPTEITNTPE